MYSVNDVENTIGEGEFIFLLNEQKRESDLQMTIFVKSQYRFKSSGKFSHCIKIFDASGKEIIQAEFANQAPYQGECNPILNFPFPPVLMFTVGGYRHDYTHAPLKL